MIRLSFVFIILFSLSGCFWVIKKKPTPYSYNRSDIDTTGTICRFKDSSNVSIANTVVSDTSDTISGKSFIFYIDTLEALSPLVVNPNIPESSYDLPIILPNKGRQEVRTFIALYQTKHRGWFEAALARSGRYLPLIKSILKEEGMPQDLAYIVLVESSFHPLAYSRARARGLWQFIVPTGLKYGLRIDVWMDERCDPVKSTRAAIEYLKFLYETFNSWELALASYNCGENYISALVNSNGTNNFWELSKGKGMPRETKGYVPSIIASTIIAKNPERYGFKINYDPPIEYDEVNIESSLDLYVAASCASTTYNTIKELNPELNLWRTPANYPNYKLKIPKGTDSLFYARYAQVPKYTGVSWIVYNVRRGDTISEIADAYGLSVSEIVSINYLNPNGILPVGRTLLLPLKSTDWAKVQEFNRKSQIRDNEIRQKEIATYKSDKSQVGAITPVVPSEPNKFTKKTHIVKSGETLWGISQIYGVSYEDIEKWSGLPHGAKIYPNDKLTIWVKEESSVASTEKTESQKTKEPENQKTGKQGDVNNPQSTTRNLQSIVHTVQKGETLWGIAQKYDTTPEKIQEWNKMKSNRIYPGDKLTIWIEK